MLKHDPLQSYLAHDLRTQVTRKIVLTIWYSKVLWGQRSNVPLFRIIMDYNKMAYQNHVYLFM